jgi:Mn-containing catalase
MPTSSGPSTSNNWGWSDILKKVFTLVELGPLQKWAAKPIGNKSDNTLKKMSDNTLKTRSEWQHTQDKKWVTTHSRKDEYYSSKECFQEDHEGSS